jgi:hypothetical protein
MDEGMKEVRFDIYCETCEYKDLKDEDEPCCDCLDEPANQHSHKPVYWKGAKE